MWVLNGVSGEGETPPTCAGTYKGVLLIMGSGRCLWKDLEKFKDLNIKKYDKMAINYAGLFCGDIDHWASLHHEQFRWLPYLMIKFYPDMTRSSYRIDDGVLSHTFKGHIHINKVDNEYKANVWNMLGVDGTSGMFATMIGIALGYDKIILAGIPLDGSGHFYTPPESRTEFDRATHIAWGSKKDLMKSKVRAISGYIKKIVGEPTKEWLDA